MGRYGQERDGKEELWFKGTVLADTGRAILFLHEDVSGDDDAVWLPHSLIEQVDGEYDKGMTPASLRQKRPEIELLLPRWKAEEVGLA